MQVFEQKAPGAMKRFMAELGVTDFQAAGMMGNAGWESAGLTTLHQIRGTAIGWFQDDGARKIAFLDWCHTKGLDWESDEANIGYCIRELQTSERAALNALKATKTLKEACDVFEAKFERAGVPALSGRELYAARAMAAYKASAQAAPTSKLVPASGTAQAVIGSTLPPQAPVPSTTPAPPAPKPVPEGIWGEFLDFLHNLL